LSAIRYKWFKSQQNAARCTNVSNAKAALRQQRAR
jgi:hypothetical protein